MKIRKRNAVAAILAAFGLFVVYAWYVVEHTDLGPPPGCSTTTEGNC